MTNDIDPQIDSIIKSSIEAFTRSKEEEPEEEPKEESEEKPTQEEGASQDEPKDTPAESPEETEPLPDSPIDFSAMSDDDLVMFIEMAADKLGLENIIDGDDEPAGEEIAEAAADVDPDLE